MNVDYGDNHVRLGVLCYGDLFQYGSRYCIKGFDKSNADVVTDVENGEVFHLELETQVIEVPKARVILR